MSQNSVFISYRRDDTPGHVGRLYDNLSDHFNAKRVFMDLDHIEPGDDFAKTIEEALGSCSVLVAVIGRNWLRSSDGKNRCLDNPQDCVRLEIAAALKRNIRVIPVLVNGAKIPEVVDLPDDLKGLLRKHAQELSEHHWKQDVDRLIKKIESDLGKSTPWRTKRLILAAAGVLILLIAGTLLYQFKSALLYQFYKSRSAGENQNRGRNQNDGGAVLNEVSKLGAIPPAPAGMTYVPGGTLNMGRNEGDLAERPAHLITVDPFFIDRDEVTNADYEKFVQATSHPVPMTWVDGTYPANRARKPVTGVTWDDANAYAKWATKRLPTEEEWEFAARGTDGRLYPWGNAWQKGLANADNPSKGLTDVGSYRGTSPFGAFDMVGNAWEWTGSEMRAYPQGHLPANLEKGILKVIRGGSYQSTKENATTTYRTGWPVNGASDYANTGFRCAADVVH